MIDRDMQDALKVDPSPEFVARVRMRIANEPAPSAWRWSWSFAATAACAAAIAIAVVVSRPWQPRDAAQVFPPAHAADLVLRSRSAPAVQERVAPRPADAGLKPRATRAAEAFARQRSASAAEPEILIDPREGLALRRLLAGVRAGRVDLAAVANASAPAVMELPAIQAIEIPAITIDPLTPSGEQGAPQ